MILIVIVEIFFEIDLIVVFKVFFLCGLIIGVFKVWIMEIILELEDFFCGVYCGVIGFLEFNGNVIFNVLICIIVIVDNKVIYGVGGGIVWDLEVVSEFFEIYVKLVILEKMIKFFLIECLWIENGEFFWIEYYLKWL